MTKYLELEDRVDFATDASSPTTQPPISHAAGEAMEDDLSLEDLGSETAFEVCSEGPLTYFRYYFEEVDASASAIAQPKSSAKINPLSASLVGAGVLTMAAVSGLVIADALKDKPEAAAPKGSTTESQTQNKQSPTQPQSQPTPAPPETLNPNPLLSNKATASPLPQPTTPAAAAKPSASKPLPSAQLQTVARSTIAAIPSTVLPSLPVLQAPPPPAPQMVQPASPAKPQASVAPNSSQPAAPAASGTSKVAMASVAPPETLMPQQASATPAAAVDAVNSGATAPAPSVAPTANSSPVQAEAAKPAVPAAPMPPESTSSSGEKTSDQAADQADKAAASDAIAIGPSKFLNTAQGIQDFLTLPQKAPQGVEVSLMPLTEKAAKEAEAAKQVGAFSILKLAPQAYISEWRTSNKSSVEPDSVSGLPAYGFIDYQRQLIVVLNDTPALTSLNSR